MKQRTIFDIDGKTYMSPKGAADKWNNISRRDSTAKWIIPINAQQPIDDEKIRQILISLLCLKNNPNLETTDDKMSQIEVVVEYLKKTGFLKDDDSTNLRDLVLTEKGIHLATEGRKLQVNWINAGITLVQVVASIMTIWTTIA